mmetsp:Transcript_35371/g.54136  ORF Transcript_35371/g.54136 Transcript_35371/m.54136 type:complete len:172 (+) Transcript_35371:2435-2950(+)
MSRLQQLQTLGIIDYRLFHRNEKKIQEQQKALLPILNSAKKKLIIRNKLREIHAFLKERVFFMNWGLSTFFENTIYLIILVSMILLIIDNPFNDPEGDLHKTIEKIDRVISNVFVFEAILRIGALGFFSSCLPGRKGYIRSGSNQIDFFVSVVCDMTLIVSEQAGLKAITS